MNKCRKKVIVLLTIMLLSLEINTTALAAGCSDYYKVQTGVATCTNKLCPGGLKRKERQDLYHQKCVRDNGTIYYNKDYKTVYISCSCT